MTTTVLLAPATVPPAQPTRLRPEPWSAPPVRSAAPAAVPLAEPVVLPARDLTPAQVAQLRAELDAVRRELARILGAEDGRP